MSYKSVDIIFAKAGREMFEQTSVQMVKPIIVH